MRIPRPSGARSKERGAAALEFSISLIFLVPLLLGIVDVGYYFWIAVNATEAANEGAKAASRLGAGVALCTAGTVPGITTSAQGVATTYLTNSLPAGVGTRAAYVECRSLDVVGDTVAWRTRVQVDYRPPIGIVRVGMKPSTVVTPNGVMFTTPWIYSP